MCGIVGYIDKKNSYSNEYHRIKIQEIAQTLTHRGPDSFGEWVDEACGIAIGHRRLAILDLSPDGHQPMVSDCGRYILSYNGEIYNYQELKRKLINTESIKGSSDTEVILKYIIQFGLPHALQAFNGMFAFSLWDREQRKLYLVRDRLGIKPLYYAQTNKSFIWGSELKPLMKSGFIEKEIDIESLGHFFKYNRVPAPRSIFKGVYKLLPGTILEFDLKKKTSKTDKFWDPLNVFQNGIDNTFDGTTEEAITKLEELLDSAVGLRMISDVPLGAFLSGGIDSSLIVATMQKLSSKPIKSFSIGFEEEQFNEAEYAKAVAKHLGTDHTEMYVSEQDALNVIPDLPDMWDEPFADSSQIPTYLVSKMTKQHVTVALSGDGGDELFGGYTRYHTTDILWKRLNMIPYPIRKLFSEAVEMAPNAVINYSYNIIKSILSEKFRFKHRPSTKIKSIARVIRSNSVSQLYDEMLDPFKSINPVQNFENHYKDLTKLPQRNIIEGMMGYDLMNYLPDDILTKVDRASMANSLEARVPLLDYRLVEFSYKLPFNLKVHQDSNKWILKKLLYSHIPKELMDRPKMGFGVPLATWFRGPLKDWSHDMLNEKDLRRHNLLDVRLLKNLLEQHMNGKADYQVILWNTLVFQSWYDRWMK